MERVILHSDFNAFYCGVEAVLNPSLNKGPFAVTGSADKRHGIILSKSEMAKKAGVKTGQPLYEAKRLCPDIRFVTARFGLYEKYSAAAKEIYYHYTDRVEPFGLDESWLDLSGSTGLFGSGPRVADDIREKMKRELGLSCSVGVSFNKIFAKLGSDYKKPDGTTVITKENFKQVVWPLPARDLLYVGPATEKKLKSRGMHTIGDIANADPVHLRQLLGANGITLWRFANGEDNSRVSEYGEKRAIKSIGNSKTTVRDLVCEQDIRMTVMGLCESVAERLRKERFLCKTLQVQIRDSNLVSFERQAAFSVPTNISSELYTLATQLILSNWGEKPLRSLGVRACNLLPMDEFVQLSLYPEEVKRMQLSDLDFAIDGIREKYGYLAINRGVSHLDKRLIVDIKDNHLVFPPGVLGML